MRIGLLSAPAISYHAQEAHDGRGIDTFDSPPLGILTLAAVLESQGFTPAVIDLNRVYEGYCGHDREFQAELDFCAFATARISGEFDLIGLGTACNSYPLTLRLARLLKDVHPEAVIVLGGPQASVVDRETLRAFPWVDLVVRGEAEETIVRLVESGLRLPAIGRVPGITYRDGAGQVVRSPDAPPIGDLDRIPFPAFHLAGGIDETRYIPLEAGRGCPFSCTFCSTSDFFRRRFRLKSPETLLEHMRRVQREYGVSSFDLVHDVFTADRKRVEQFCAAMVNAGEGFRWACSARTDCVDEELIRLMRAAGCQGLFFGVETGSPRLQRSIHKGLVLTEAAARVAYASAEGITTTVSLITGFPEETSEDVRETVAFLMDAARWDEAEPQLHILAPLAGTPLTERFRGRLVLDEVYSDMSHQGWWQEEADRELIVAYPEIFVNFYGLPAPGVDRRRLKRLRDFTLHGLARLRWLLIALHQTRGGLVAVFDDWERLGPKVPDGGMASAAYYASATFRKDFLEFVRRTHLREADPALEALVRFEEALENASPPRRQQQKEQGCTEIVPVVPDDVRVVAMDVDLGGIIAHLRRGEGLPLPEERPVSIAMRRRESGGSDIIRLTPFSAAFLQLSDGSRTLAEVASELRTFADLAGVTADQLCAVAPKELERQRLITFRAQPICPSH